MMTACGSTAAKVEEANTQMTETDITEAVPQMKEQKAWRICPKLE